MNAKLRKAVLGVASLVILGLGLPVTAGGHPTDVVEDPVSTFGHAADHWGWHNDWGTHDHDDHWTDHPYHGGIAGDGHHGPHGTHGPHGPHGAHSSYGPHSQQRAHSSHGPHGF